jgi:tRNA dimethylallyltransferase
MPCLGAASRNPTTPDLPPLIVIAGATATGKTALAVALAERLPGAEIVSADSRQVYRGMDIATAKPTPAELSAARHHCLDLVAPDDHFTAADYRQAALDALHGIAARGGLGLLVGGTGLYLRAIARGLPLDQSDSDPDVRAELDARYAQQGLAPLVAELRALDAAAADEIDLRNPRRVIRALERARLTGSAWPPAPLGYPAPVVWLGLRRDAPEHRRRISARIAEHFAGGLLDEAQRLVERYPEDLPAFSAMGYREAFGVIAGRLDVDEARARDAQRTWVYAKRQRTWFRAEADIEWLEAGEGSVQAAAERLAPFLRDIEREDYAGAR